MGLMALPREYTNQACSMVRALEIVGERWTLLIVRDAVFGVRRFSDFLEHLGIPRAVLTERLEFLIGEEVLARVPGSGQAQRVRADAEGPGALAGRPQPGGLGRRVLRTGRPPARVRARVLHGEVTPSGVLPPLRRKRAGCRHRDHPGPGLAPQTPDDDQVTTALARPAAVAAPDSLTPWAATAERATLAGP